VRRVLPLALIVALALTGCTATKAAPTATPTASPTVADTALRPVYTPPLTQATAKAETERLADAIDDLVLPTSILYVSNASQLIPASGKTPASWGVLREVTLDPSTDPSQVAQSVVAVLEHSGWVLLHNTTDTGTEVIALASGTATKTAWYVLVSGDASKAGQSVVSVQLGSPDIPS
jgi:hypothetical protein